MMNCKYCGGVMSDEQALAGGHDKCVALKNERSKNKQCVKCGKPNKDDDIVYHYWCNKYSGYVSSESAT